MSPQNETHGLTHVLYRGNRDDRRSAIKTRQFCQREHEALRMGAESERERGSAAIGF